MKQKVIIEIISVLLILLFVYASTSKLLNYALFVTQLKASPFLYYPLFFYSYLLFI